MLERLKKYGQEHLLEYYESLLEEEKKELKNEIDNINFDLINNLFLDETKEIKKNENKIEPIIPVELTVSEEKRLFNLGLEFIKKGSVAVVLMAGGQGTRLGHKGPKGTFDIGLPSHKSIFNIHCDKLNRLYDLTGKYIYWYIMTSEDNHLETVNHFKKNNYFDYNSKFIKFFKQDRMPAVHLNGKIALKNKSSIVLTANGNGGVFSSLNSSNILSEMNNNNVTHVFLCGVDNVLLKIADPTFIGFSIENKADINGKAVDKINPNEKVGIICNRNSHPDLIEYSELNDELKNKRDENGKLTYRNSNIVSFIFTLEFLNKCKNKNIPFHKAFKKINKYKNGKVIEALEPNGYKYELFMFDVFRFTDSMPVLTVLRNEEFAPVKNSEGTDSPESARKMILNLHKKWLEKAGFNYITNSTEVNTKISYKGENLVGKEINSILVDV